MKRELIYQHISLPKNLPKYPSEKKKNLGNHLMIYLNFIRHVVPYQPRSKAFLYRILTKLCSQLLLAHFYNQAELLFSFLRNEAKLKHQMETTGKQLILFTHLLCQDDIFNSLRHQIYITWRKTFVYLTYSYAHLFLVSIKGENSVFVKDTQWQMLHGRDIQYAFREEQSRAKENSFLQTKDKLF